MADPISPFTPQMQSQISQLLQSQVDRSQQSNPVHQAAMAMAMRMAPGYAQGAVGAPGGAVPSVGGSITPASSGSSGPGVGTTAAAAFAAALMKAASGSGAGGDLGKLLAFLKSKFGGGPGVQGNQPFAGGALPSGNPGMGFGGWDPSVSDPSGQPYLPSDPGFFVGGGQPSDPSGGTGVGPGMQGYYDALDGDGQPGPKWGG